MSSHWWHTFSIGLNAESYASSNFSLSTTSNIVTNGTTNLNSPPASSNAPGEQYNLQLGSGILETPAFPNGAISEGWVIFRFNASGTGILSASPLVRICDLVSGSTVRVTLRASTAGATSTLSLFVNSTLVGTTSSSIGDATVVLAIQVNLAANPPQAGLVINGVQEINLAGGSGSPTTIDRLRLSGGKGGAGERSFLGDVSVFNDLDDFSDIARTQDVWVTFLRANNVTDPDSSWTPTTVDLLEDIRDRDITTYDYTTTDPDTIQIAFESTTDRQPGWDPTVIYGVAPVAYGTAAVITNTTLSMSDSNGTVGSDNRTLNAIGYFLGTWHSTDSQGDPWTAFEVNSVTVDYDVSS